MNKITYFGSEKDIKKTVAILKKHRRLTRIKEGKARLKIQELIDQHGLKATILLNGNTVWSKRRILTNLRRIMKTHTLYNEQQDKPPILSHYFYEFLHTECGSLDHYDIHGWIHKYPTLEDLKKFFMNNEFGKRVLEWIPKSHTDAIEIVKQIEALFFPFQSYMQHRETQ